MAQVNLGRVVGYSAYEIAVQNGFEGTEAEWLASLKGETGATGPQGPQGEQGPQGAAGPTYTAGTGISIENNVISATGGSGGGMDEDDVKELIYEEYGMSKVIGAEPMRSITDTLGNTLNISAEGLHIWVSNWTDFINECPQIKVQIWTMGTVLSNVEVMTAPGEGSPNAQSYQAWFDGADWHSGITYDTTPTYVLSLEFTFDEIGGTNVVLSKITLRDSASQEVSGSYNLSLYKVTFTKLNDGFINPYKWATKNELYNDEKAQQYISETYGLAPGSEEWRDFEGSVTIAGGTGSVSIDYDPINNNDIQLYDDGDTHLGYFTYDNGFVYYDDAGEISNAFGLDYRNNQFDLSGEDGDYVLKQSYAVQIDASPLNADYIPSEVWDEIDNIRQVPVYTSSDAGKVLSVNSRGDLEWISLPSASGVSF